jgi:NAD-dependent SIR2 family protein deacetylase
MYSNNRTRSSTGDYLACIELLKEKIESADAIIVGAGAGLSTSAGFVYSGERFDKYFYDFGEKYGITDIYSGGFYPYKTLEEYWAWWSRQIWINRYMPAPNDVYDRLLELLKDKNYFVITTNVDHCFQKAGIDKAKLFYTQGDYGLVQCSKPCHQKTYDNFNWVRTMLETQGFSIGDDGTLSENGLKGKVLPEQVPRCPKCGRHMVMNLRSDNKFVEDEGWHIAQNRYAEFLKKNKKGKLLLLELGVGGNTPVIIKYPFWRLALENKTATYACVNKGEAFAPREIESQSICIDEDIFKVVKDIEG